MNSTNNENKKAIVIIDMLYDFIDGTLACINGENAVKVAKEFIENNQDFPVYYVLDHHPENHSSFKEFGGIWPAHCVAGTRGGMIHEDFTTLTNGTQSPNEKNCFYKGTDSAVEQYSGFESMNSNGEALASVLPKNIIVCGIATEFCVFNSCKDFLSAGFNVELMKDALAYVDLQGHKEAMVKMVDLGIELI